MAPQQRPDFKDLDEYYNILTKERVKEKVIRNAAGKKEDNDQGMPASEMPRRKQVSISKAKNANQDYVFQTDPKKAAGGFTGSMFDLSPSKSPDQAAEE